MFLQQEHTVKDRTPDNDLDIELLFRANDYQARKGREELQQLNTLVDLISDKYQLNDVWGRSYKSNPQLLSLRFADSDINGMKKKHPLLQLMEASGIQQIREQGQYRHLKYAVFTFNTDQCKDLIKAVNLLNPDATELMLLSEHAKKGQVLC